MFTPGIYRLLWRFKSLDFQSHDLNFKNPNQEREITSIVRSINKLISRLKGQTWRDIITSIFKIHAGISIEDHCINHWIYWYLISQFLFNHHVFIIELPRLIMYQLIIIVCNCCVITHWTIYTWIFFMFVEFSFFFNLYFRLTSTSFSNSLVCMKRTHILSLSHPFPIRSRIHARCM